MEFSIYFYTVRSVWSIRYILGVTGYNIQRNIEFLSLKIVFVLKYSVDPDEISLCLHCFTMHPFWCTNSMLLLIPKGITYYCFNQLMDRRPHLIWNAFKPYTQAICAN